MPRGHQITEGAGLVRRLWVPVPVCGGDRGRRQKIAKLGATGLPSPADFPVICSQLAKHHPTARALCPRLLFLYPANGSVPRKCLGCFVCTPRSYFPWCTAQNRELTGAELVSDYLTTGVELNRLINSLQGF